MHSAEAQGATERTEPVLVRQLPTMVLPGAGWLRARAKAGASRSASRGVFMRGVTPDARQAAEPWEDGGMDEGALRGRRVLVLRAREQLSGLRDGLEALGADVRAVPVIEIVPPASWRELDEALACDAAWDWLVLTSANAAESVAGRLLGAGRTAGFARVAVIGAATRARAREVGLLPGATEVLTGERAVAESLAEALVPRVRALVEQWGRPPRVLLPRAEVARDVLPEALRAAGAEVVVATAYRNQVPATAPDALGAMFGGAGGWRPEAVPFSSSSSVTGLLGALQEAGVRLPEEVRCVSIGEVTSRSLREQGLRVDAEATVATVASLIEAVVQALAVA